MTPLRPVLLVLDAGTSSIRAALFDETGRLLKLHRRSITTRRPRPGHAELDPAALLAATDQVIGRCLKDCRRHELTPVSLGLSVQRSSFLLWDASGRAASGHKAAGPVISWQDTRAATIIDRFSAARGEIAMRTGLPLSPHFGGPKLAWLVAGDPTLKPRLAQGTLKFVPLSSLLIQHLTGNLLVDETIAGRSLVYDIHRRKWDEGLLETFGWPKAALPELVPSASEYGTMRRAGFEVPLLVCLGDQQAAMTGLGATGAGELAINYGTSGSVMLNTGQQPALVEGLLSNVAWSTAGRAEYLLEGTVNAVGALFRWFAEEEGRPELVRRWSRLAASDTDLVLVPGINGLAAPYWRPDVQTTFYPPVGDHSLGDRLRAGIASIAHLTTDIVERMAGALPDLQLTRIHCGGGMAQPPLLQLQADLLERSLHRHRIREATARGVALRLAGLLGWDDFATGSPHGHTPYTPAMTAQTRTAHRRRWQAAVEQALGG